jgi:uncharacterized membrane protein YdjX (TVP38/TMEM64 family)
MMNFEVSAQAMAQDNTQSTSQRRKGIWLAVIILLLLCAVAAAWKFTPLADFLDLKRLAVWSQALRTSPTRHVYLLVIYIVGSVLLVPITVLILLTAIIFGPLWGSVYATVGCLAGAAVTYGIGYLIGQDLVQKIAGSKWSRLERKIEQTGIVAVAALRLLPVAPFTIVNIVSGAFKVPLWHYAMGSFVGLVPGILITNLFAHQVERAVRDPGIGTFLVLAVLTIATIIASVWLKRKFAS